MVKAVDGEGQEIERTQTNADGSVTVSLASPIKVMNEERGTLTLKRPRAKQLRKIGKGGVDDALKLIAALANVPDPTLDELDSFDLGTISKVIEGFTKQPPRIGAE
jgi:hypothetical protein